LASIARKSLLEELPLCGLDIERRRSLVGLSAADATRLARLAPVLAPVIDTLVGAHLARQLAVPEVAALAPDAATRERMRLELTGFVGSLFSGRYDEDYASGRLAIGFVHRRIGLAARYFLAALHQLHVDLRAAIAARVPDADEAARAGEALERLLLLDQSLIFDAYEHRLVAEARREHARALRYASNLEQQVAERTRALEQLSRTDPLTGLRNRRAFLEELSREVNRAGRQRRPLAALYIDIDDFKGLNDREGHARGDEALAAVARALAATLRSTDAAARLGGDEFCILLPDTDDRQAAAIAARLRERVRALCAVTVSIGIATFEDDDLAGPAALVGRADADMYRTKRRRTTVMGAPGAGCAGRRASGAAAARKPAARRHGKPSRPEGAPAS
jgi:diguanylate cyclase (GGDEF)-like protein